MSLAILCPGQGNQHPRMFEALLDRDVARQILNRISELTGLALDTESLVRAEAAGQLAANKIAQVLVVGHSLALCAVLSGIAEDGLVVAGYSVGDLAAHSVAGAISATDAMSLAQARGAAMDRAAEIAGRSLGMTGIKGLAISSVETLVAGTGVELALINGRDHVVIGGPLDALAGLEERALAEGAHVRRLGVKVASHTSYLQAAVKEFRLSLEACEWRQPKHRLLSPIDGAPVTGKARAVDCLARQIEVRLDWESTMQSLCEYGSRRTLELGSGRALSNIVAEEAPSLAARAVEDFKTLDGLRRWIGNSL